MNVNRSASAIDSHEMPISFEAGQNVLLGILSIPPKPHGIGVVVAGGGWFGSSAGRNRLLVRLCRELAARGFYALRFDYHGVGESTGAISGFRLDKPFTLDVMGAVRELERFDIQSVQLIGVCFGARTILDYSSTDSRIGGMVLISPSLRRQNMEGKGPPRTQFTKLPLPQMARAVLRPAVLKGLANRRRRKQYERILRAKLKSLVGSTGKPRRDGGAPSWVSEAFLSQLALAIRRQVPMMFLFGSEDVAYQDFVEACSGELGSIIDSARDLIQVETIGASIHGFGHLDVQEGVIRRVADWVSALQDGDGRARMLSKDPDRELSGSPSGSFDADTE